MNITDDQLRAVCTALGDDVKAWTGPLNAALLTIGADTPRRAADYVTQWAHESREFTRLEENLDYSAARLVEVFGKYFTPFEAADFAHKPERIASRVYANRMGNGDEGSGDGWLYCGRGLAMITGRDNYRACSIAICGDADTLLLNPELLLEPNYAMAAAAAYWADRDLNSYSDRDDFDGLCDVINFGHKTAAQGDANGYEDRKNYRRRAFAAFGIPYFW